MKIKRNQIESKNCFERVRIWLVGNSPIKLYIELVRTIDGIFEN